MNSDGNIGRILYCQALFLKVILLQGIDKNQFEIETIMTILRREMMTLGFDEIRLTEESEKTIITLIFKGKLEKEDYELFVPQVEKIMESRDKIRMFVELHDFKGWSAGALWEDTKFGIKHFNDIERLAILGEKKWEKPMAAFVKPFTTAQVKYFDMANREKAHEWIVDT